MITPSSMETIQLFARVRLMREFGASLHGGNLSKWPSKVVDAFVLLQDEHTKVENMRIVRDNKPQNRAAHH